MSKKSALGATSVGVLSSLLAFLGFVSCCGMPILAGILSSIGVGATQLSFFAEYQPYFLLLSIISLGFGFWSLYFRRSGSGCCAPQPTKTDSCCTPKKTVVKPTVSRCAPKGDQVKFTPTAPVVEKSAQSCCDSSPKKKMSFKAALPQIIIWVAALFVAKILYIDMGNHMNEGEGMNTLIGTMQYFVFIVVELIVLFVAITAIIELIMMHIPQTKLRKWLSGRGIWGNFFATIFGALTPFCACSTIPMTVGFLRAGVSFGSVMSFLISSPLLNPIIIGMLVALMGIQAAAVYFVVAFVASILFGYILDKMNGVKYVKPQYLSGANGSIDNVVQEDARRNLPFGLKCKEGVRAGWNTLKPVMGYLIIGVAIGAGIYGYLPEELILKIAGEDNPFAIPVAAVMGVPLYIRAETAIPIGIALMGKGMSVGAVIALIIGGAGMAIPEMSMMASIFKRKLVAMIVIVIFLTAVIGGYVFNMVM